MSIETSPKWVQEQVRTGLDLDKKMDIKQSIEDLSKETLIAFFKKNSDIVFKKEAGPANSAAHILAYQKALNLLGASLDIDGQLGPKTIAVIQKFQIAQKLKGTNGIPGPETIGALRKALENSLPKEKTGTEAPIEKTELDTLLNSNGYMKQPDGSYKNQTNNTVLRIIDKKVSAEPNPGLSSDDQKKKIALMGRILDLVNSTSAK